MKTAAGTEAGPAGAPPRKAAAARTDADILAKAAAPAPAHAHAPEPKPATSGVAAPAPAPMRVRVVTGDLAFARHPVIVGHFLGDSIAGAEASLDLALDSSLKKRYALGVYPGAVGTAMVVPAPGGACPRGVVIGLGDIGEFSPGMIRAALISGLLELGLSPHRPDGEDGVSLILLGTRAGTVSSSDTLTATLAALTEAQRRLAEQGLRPFPEVDFVALYEDDSHKIWHTLRRFEQSPHYKDSFTLEREVVYSAGAQRRLMRLEDPDFWRAIQITAADAAKGEVGYRFVAVGERARAEGYLVGADETFVSKFIRAAQNRQLEAAPTRALFQLIWPPELKQSSQDDRNLRLILDVAAAALPFELMDDRPTPAEGEAVHSRPPAVRRGMLRQLIQSRFARLQTSPRGGRRALVIGDPRGGVAAPDFEALAGAREEAETVATLLENEGYEVVRLIGDSVTPDQVVEHILQGGWTILHVSAHGIYNYAFRTDRDEATAKGWDGKGSSYTGPRHTGIVLGDRLTLSPSILQSMPDPPVLAFINCCDLASVNPGDEARLRSSARPEFAASFAGELIALGTRAVIAAGWEVSDAGALIFAQSAYRELLTNNQGFGDAVRIARGDVYDAEPDDATWGAYQCYGEPDWRLHPDSEIKVRSWPSPVFASPTEAMAAIEGVRNRAKLGGIRRHFGMLKRLAVIDSMLGKLDWLERDGVREQLGHAYLALGEPKRALEHFEEALKHDAGPTLKLVEALADIRIHEAGGRPRHAGAGNNMGNGSGNMKGNGAGNGAGPGDGEIPPDDALAEIASAREQLVYLCEIAGKTAERLSLIGGAARREALLLAGEARDGALAQMADSYRQAWALSRARQSPQAYYPGLMTAMAGLLTALRSGGDLASCRAELDDVARDVDEEAGPGRHGAPATMLSLLRALAEEQNDAETARDLAARFRRSCENGRNAAQRDSILGRLRLIAAMLAEKDESRGAAEWVGSIEAEVAATTEPPPSARPAAAARREAKAKPVRAYANEPAISLKD